MKKLFILTLFLAFFVGCKNAPKYAEIKSTKEISNQMYFAEKTIISAHRAGKGIKGYPENCLETIQFLSKKGIHSFEIDIFESADGQLFLMHDDKLGRTCTGSGLAIEKTSQELWKENLIDDFGNVTSFKMPLLKDVLAWCYKNKGYLMLDFKKGVSYQKVAELVRAENMQHQVVFISYNTQQAKKIHEVAPEMLISATIRNEEELNRTLETGIPQEKILAFTGIKLSEKSLYEKLASKKIPSILGTLGNLDKRAESKGNHLYKEWSALGIQVFSTDRPLDVNL